MKILVVSPFFYPHKGGSQQYAEQLYYHLMRANSRIKVDVLCYNTDNASEKEEYQGMTIYRIPCVQILPGQFAVPNYIKLWKLIRKLHKKNKYSFINAHTRFFESSWWVPFVAKYMGSKSMLTDHCADHPKQKSKLITQFATLVDKYFVPIFIRNYDVIAVTNKATLEFISKMQIKIPRIIYGGVDSDYFKPNSGGSKRCIPKIKRKFNRPDIIVTFLGRLIHSKGPQILITAAERILKNQRNVYFIFAGSGELYKKLSGVKNKHILFTGPLDRKRVACLLENTDIFVHPSFHHEGFPNVLLEAGASGCAVIATRRGGTDEIIIHNKTGVLAKPTVTSIEKNLLELIDNKRRREKLGKALRKHIRRNFDWRIIVKEYHRLITSTISPKSLRVFVE